MQAPHWLLFLVVIVFSLFIIWKMNIKDMFIEAYNSSDSKEHQSARFIAHKILFLATMGSSLITVVSIIQGEVIQAIIGAAVFWVCVYGWKREQQYHQEWRRQHGRE